MDFIYPKFDLQHHGDYLERLEFNFIRTHLNAYEEIWKRFIGHDGKGKMPELDIPADLKKLRTDFGEHMYTCLESVVCMRFIVEDVSNLKIEKYGDYVNFLNSLMCFQSHAGRVRDNAKKLTELVIGSKKEQDKINRILEEYYKQRNNVLHARKIPFAIYEKSVLIPIPQGTDTSDLKKWSSDMSWDDITSKSDIEFLPDYLKMSLDGIIMHLNQLLSNLIHPVKDIVDKFDIILISPNEPYFDLCPSGSTQIFPSEPGISFGKTVSGPSGGFYNTEEFL